MILFFLETNQYSIGYIRSEEEKRIYLFIFLLCSICLFVCLSFLLLFCFVWPQACQDAHVFLVAKEFRSPGTGVPDGCELRTEPQLSVRVERACKCWASPKAVSNLPVLWKQWTSVSFGTIICMTYPIRWGLSKTQKQMSSSCLLCYPEGKPDCSIPKLLKSKRQILYDMLKLHNILPSVDQIFWVYPHIINCVRCVAPFELMSREFVFGLFIGDMGQLHN